MGLYHIILGVSPLSGVKPLIQVGSIEEEAGVRNKKCFSLPL